MPGPLTGSNGKGRYRMPALSRCALVCDRYQQGKVLLLANAANLTKDKKGERDGYANTFRGRKNCTSPIAQRGINT